MHQTTFNNQHLNDNLKLLKVLKDAERKYIIKLLYAPLSTRLKTT